MGVTLISSTDSPATVRPSVEWVLRQSDGGTFPIEKLMFHRLGKTGQGWITKRRVTEHTPQDVPLNFSDIIRDFLLEELPDPLDNTAFPDNNMYGDFHLEYGEYINDLSVPGPPVESGTMISQDIRVLRSGFQYYENDWMMESGDVAIFTNKPDWTTTQQALRLDIDQSDWIYIYVKASISGFQTTWYDSMGAEITSASVGYFPQSATGFPMGPANHRDGGLVDWTTVQYYEIKVGPIDLGSGDVLAPIKIFRIYVDKCPENIDEKELYWLEPAGGYASIRMEDITFGMNRVSNRFEQYTELRASIENRMRDGGFEIGRVDSHEVITLVKDIPNGAYGLRRYYNGIFASRVAWIRMKDVD